MWKVSVRCLHTTYAVSAGLNKTMGRFLAKAATNKKRKYCFNDFSPTLSNPRDITKTKFEHSKLTHRRIAVLNKLFMNHISDQMINSEIVSFIEGKGFEITRLKITPDFTLINVYWSSTKIFNDPKFEEDLKHVAGLLRHELSKLKVIGIVPKIQFVKDKYVIHLIELDKTLAKADFGEDYVPNKSTNMLKTELSLNMMLETKILEKVKEIDTKYDDVEDLNIPEMNHCVFGLDRENILNKIQKGKDSSVYSWSNYDKDQPFTTDSQQSTIDNVKSLNSSTMVDRKKRRAEFENFLRNREIILNKMKEDIQKYNKENEAPLLKKDEENFIDDYEDSEFEEHMYFQDDNCNDDFDNETIK